MGRERGRSCIVGLVLSAVLGLAAGCPSGSGAADQPEERPSTEDRSARDRPTASASAASISPDRAEETSAAGQDPARYASQVRTYARQAGINPQLLMAILYNESYKPHNPALERAWQRIDADAALGIANMHRAAFDEAKHGRDFASRDWQELPDDPDLAIQAAAWHLHDLARRVPSRRTASYTTDELLALGYNAGASSMRSFATGARPGQVAQSYLDRLHDNWDRAATALRSTR